MDSQPSPPGPTAPVPVQSTALGLCLGLDVGGTQTRWALLAPGTAATPATQVLAEGSAPAWSGLMLLSAPGRAAIAQALAEVRAQVDTAEGRLAALVAGVTGLGPDQGPELSRLLGDAFGLPVTAVAALNDIELACHAAFGPGEGFVLYAGTGSVAAFLDAQGQLQRAGGRGAVIDDAGGGHWIACQALRAVWRAEDEAPGAWRHSLLAQRLFDVLGGSDWAATRQWVYGASRGELGTLALAVAAAAEQGDAQASHILDSAGRELARLVLALARRHGPRPVVLAGRAFDLHPRLPDALRAELQAAAARALTCAADTPDAPDASARAGWATLAQPQQRALRPHLAAAHLAAARFVHPSSRP